VSCINYDVPHYVAVSSPLPLSSVKKVSYSKIVFANLITYYGHSNKNCTSQDNGTKWYK
jgi:hypothetical protein